MKITKDKLRELRIYNPHNLASRAGSKLYIGYIPGEEGRMAHYPYWAVVGINFKVSPNSHWAHYGNRHFNVTCRENKAPVLNEVMQWCFDTFKISKDQWEKDPYGGWQIKGTIDKAVANHTIK